MNSNQPKPAPTAPREYVIPDEECLPKYFKEPAPTAEEQLPPLDVTEPCKPSVHESESYTSSNRTYNWKWIYESDFDEYAEEYDKVLKDRERQLLTALAERDAALRSNREKDAQLNILRECETHRKELITELAEKNAKIAELERRGMWDCDEYTSRETKRHVETLEAQLRAVSEALKEKLETQRAIHEATLASIPFYWASEVDARDARLRSIVDGKD